MFVRPLYTSASKEFSVITHDTMKELAVSPLRNEEYSDHRQPTNQDNGPANASQSVAGQNLWTLASRCLEPFALGQGQ